MILNFNTGKVLFDHQAILMHRPTAALSYLKTWFLPDLVGSLPYDLMLDAYGVQTHGVTRFLRIVRIFKLVRILRLLTMLRYCGRLEAPVVKFLQGTRGRLISLIILAIMTQVGDGFRANMLSCIFRLN